MTTSVRLKPDLGGRLQRAAEVTGKSANRIINEALEEYLPRFDSAALRREIERQCRRANRADASDDWEAFADWRG
ncbi:MAG: CopG family ribbon-helix-helix protein [Burkholderiales bacterium]